MVKQFYISIVLLYTLSQPLLGQFDLVYSQPEHNPLAHNPAAAGSDDALSFALVSRHQWRGINGAPGIQSLNMNTPLKKTKVGIGFLAKRESYGANNFFAISFHYAYRLEFPIGKLAVGLKGGINSGSTDQIDLLSDLDDELFYADLNKYIVPEFGIGVYFYNNRMFGGVSLPQVFSPTIDEGKYNISMTPGYYNLYFTAGYHAHIAGDIVLTPSLFARYSLSNTLKTDIKLISTFRNMVDAGIGYRTGESVIVLLGYNLNQQFRVGYSYDINIGKEIGQYTKCSHEIFLKYILGYRVNVANPRTL